MGFLSPGQLIWSAAAILVVLLYVRWSMRATHVTSTLPIWKHALARRTWWSRWRRPVSIAASCVPILLISLALAQPFLSPAVQQSRSIVLVMDNTASMNAEQHGRSRLEDAKRQARRLIRNLRTHDRMAIISADSTVRVRCGLTSDRTLLHVALDGVQPTDGVGAMNDGIATARRLASQETRPVVVVISDGAFDSRHENSSDDVVWIPISGDAANMAITHLAARRLPEDPSKQHVLVEVTNFSDEPAKTTVSLQVAGQPATSLNFSVPAGQAVQQIAELAVAESALLTATLPTEDALSADNSASSLLTRAHPIQVILISQQETSPVETVLASLPQLKWTKVATVPTDVPENTLFIFDEFAPQTFPAAPALVLGAAREAELWTVGETLKGPQAGEVIDHPLTRGVDLRDVIVNDAANLQLKPDGIALIKSTGGGPLYALIPRSAGDVAVLSFSTAQSDLMMRDDFAQLVGNAVIWLTRDVSSKRESWRTTESIVLDDKTSQQLVSPYGDVNAKGANLVDVGRWQVQTDSGNPVGLLPVNLVDANESDLRARKLQHNTAWPHISWWPDLGPLWTLLVALSLVWMAGHWAFYQRGAID